jgi:hypothetical protein
VALSELKHMLIGTIGMRVRYGELTKVCTYKSLEEDSIPSNNNKNKWINKTSLPQPPK